ncbi:MULTISPECIES: hypothetical protein [Actinomadura]|uniref:Uncharacterized protein n=1 Tax=Actinomadura yumaensis TaxID=111807 RepID=A0ABW2CK19_9ACTN|nr:hypothetical protein [Actinomadura sp. J1-007]MWK33191.1 hypothetical protein [Actinomadura sp. J1-007]
MAMDAETQAALRALRDEFTEWWIGWQDIYLGWDATAQIDLDWSGGIVHVKASTPQMLRALLLDARITNAKCPARR